MRRPVPLDQEVKDKYETVTVHLGHERTDRENDIGWRGHDNPYDTAFARAKYDGICAD